MKLTINLFVLAAVLLLLNACKKNDTNSIAGAPVISAAVVSDTVRIGDTVNLHPIVRATGPLSFQWTVNDAVAGTDSTLRFVAREHGAYRMKVTTSNGIGTSSLTYSVYVLGKYENGFFIANEGWFGHGTGDLFFYDYSSDTLRPDVYAAENPGGTLGTSTTTLQFAPVFK